MAMDRWVVAIMAPLVCWILFNGLDDLLMDLAWLFLPREPERGDETLAERRMAIFVPAWNEHRVIEQMVAQNAGSLRYRNYDFFIGVYANDSLTLAAVMEARKRFPRVHIAQVPHGGPSSKADCLNWIYQRMLLFEEQNGVAFDMILTHDAEDVIHPDSLTRINGLADRYDMVQIPVLALPTPWREFTHGVYCDEFAQVELLDMPVRQLLGGFIPSNGVGTAFSRRALQKIAAAHGNKIFEPGCLTEDYENGFRVAWMGGKQIFVPLRKSASGFVATREYFPRNFPAAVKQRTRWTMGIGLQSWELHGWRETLANLYWFWRDRKSLVGNLVSPAANLLTGYAVVRGDLPMGATMEAAMTAALFLQIFQIGVRMRCSAHVYGWKFALAAPLRMVWGNAMNGASTLSAIRKYAHARLRKQPLRWIKTEHSYPNRAALVEHWKPLEEILVGSGYMTAEALRDALASKPTTRTLAAHLLKAGAISESDLYEAISLERNLPFGKPENVSAPVTRSFPVAIARKWQVLPFKLVAGHLHVAGTEPPTDEMQDELRSFSSMEIRFQLVTPTDFRALAGEYLPAALHG